MSLQLVSVFFRKIFRNMLSATSIFLLFVNTAFASQPPQIDSETKICKQVLHTGGIRADFQGYNAIAFAMEFEDHTIYNVIEQIVSHLPKSINRMIVGPHESIKTPLFSRSGSVIHLHNSNHFWTRDYFPELVYDTNGSPLYFVAFEYHHRSSNRLDRVVIFKELANQFRVPVIRSNLWLEGGNILSDGNGTLFITDKALRSNLITKRFESRTQIEEELLKVLKMRRIIWLPTMFDDATGHVDTFMMPLSSQKILLAEYPKGSNPYRVTTKIAEILSDAGYEVVRIKTPRRFRHDYHSFESLSYTNVIFLGNRVLVPQYHFHQVESVNLKNYDRQALQTWKQLGYDAIPVDARKMIDTCGSLHCLTKTYELPNQHFPPSEAP